jgi:hypothetical protein
LKQIAPKTHSAPDCSEKSKSKSGCTPCIEEPAQCCICLEEMQVGGKNVKELVCSHSFHGTCLGKWLKTSSSCPMCKRPAEVNEGGSE